MLEYYKAREEAFRQRFSIISDEEARQALEAGQEVWSAHYAEDSIDDDEDDFYFTTISLDDVQGYNDDEFRAYGPYALG
jgi:hypothetical protein